MTKENQHELKALDKRGNQLVRESARLARQEKKAIAAIIRTNARLFKGLQKEGAVLMRRRNILTGRLS